MLRLVPEVCRRKNVIMKCPVYAETGRDEPQHAAPVAQRETVTEHLFDTVQWNYRYDMAYVYTGTYRYANIHMHIYITPVADCA